MLANSTTKYSSDYHYTRLSSLKSAYIKDNDSVKAYQRVCDVKKECELQQETNEYNAVLDMINNDEIIKKIVSDYSDHMFHNDDHSEMIDPVQKFPREFDVSVGQGKILVRKTTVELAREKNEKNEKFEKDGINIVPQNGMCPLEYDENIPASSSIPPQPLSSIPASNTELLEKIKQHFQNHQIDLAEKMMNECLLSADSAATVSNNPEIDILFKDIKHTHKKMHEFLDLLNGEENWIPEKTKKDLTVKYQVIEGGLISLKLEGIIDVPILNLVNLINDPDGYPGWVPFCKQGKTLKLINRAYKATHFVMALPFPLDDRQAFPVGFSIDRFDVNGTFICVSNSFEDDTDFLSRHNITLPKKSNVVTAVTRCCGCEIIPLSRNKVKFRMVMDSDAKLKFIPQGALNWFIRKFGMGLFEKIIEESKKFKPESISHDHVKMDFYNWLSKRIDESLKETQTQLLSKK
jgi:hypothetical protein